MLFEIEIRGVSRGFCISNNISTPMKLLCNNHENKYFISILPWQQNRSDRFPLQKNEVSQSVMQFFNKTAEKAAPCCALVILGKQTIGFLLERNKFYSFNLRFECLFYILIRLSAINIVQNLFLSTKCFNGGKLTSNSNSSLTC